MQTKVQKWGNSYAVRLPKTVVNHLGLRAGSSVTIDQRPGAVVVKKTPPEESVRIKDWERFLIPTNKKKKVNISGRIDEILYGDAAR